MQHSNYSDTIPKYKEEATNIQVLNNILNNLKDFKQAIGTQLTELQIKEKMIALANLIKNMSNQMKNPYFQAFFSLL